MATVTISDATQVRLLQGSIVTSHICNDAAKLGRVVYAGTSNKVYLAAADNNYTATAKLGLIVAGGSEDKSGNVAAGEQVAVLWFGRATLGSGVTLATTTNYYLSNAVSTVKGLIGDAAGTISRRLFHAETTTTLFWNPQDMAYASS